MRAIRFLVFTVLLGHLASLALAQNPAPIQRFSSDLDLDMESRALFLMQESSHVLYWQFTQGAGTNKNVNGCSVEFIYAPSDRSWTVTATGTVESTTGLVSITFAPAKLATNSLDGNFDWVLSVTNTTGMMAFAFGKLHIQENVRATAGLPLAINPRSIDWSTFASYTNTATHGPYRAGSNVVFRAGTNGEVFVDGIVTNAVAPFRKAPTNSPVAGRVLASDGTSTNTYWLLLPGGGDMLGSVYDPAGGAAQVAFLAQLLSVSNDAALGVTQFVEDFSRFLNCMTN